MTHRLVLGQNTLSTLLVKHLGTDATAKDLSFDWQH